MADESTGNTVVRRVQLKVESPAPQLSGIDAAIGRIAELNQQLVATGALTGRVRANLSDIFAPLGSSAASAAAQTKQAMGQALAATERTSRAIASMAKMPSIPGLGKLYAVNQSFANESNFQAGDPQYRQEIFKSRGRTVKRSTVDDENFQYQESVNYEKFWNDAVKVGDAQRSRDLKAQKLWREHNKIWSDIRAQKDVQQEFLSGARISRQGGNSQTAIESQASAAMLDIRLNERLQARQRAAFLKGRVGYSSPIGPDPAVPGYMTVMPGVQGYTNPIGPAMNYRRVVNNGRVGYSTPIGPQNQPPVVAMGAQGYGVPIGPNFSGTPGGPAKPGGGGSGPAGGGKGGFGFSAGMGLIDKIGTAATWYAAYTAIHKVADTIVYSYQRMEQLELQTARLEQVFRGVGGSATALADDVMKLAAAEGRSTEEAMTSAVAWSRLGLTRREVNEAVKVSLMAANVAEISAGEATQSLSSIMAAYNLQVSELAPSLGILNQQSNTYRVTVAELLQGLSRVSGIAQGAGLSLAQLTGILTVSVQKTGQTGANMANALKTTLVRLNRDDVQEFFKKRYGMDITGTAEDLGKIQMAYLKANDEQKRDIILKVGSATQANRLRAIFDTYTESVFAAVDSLQHLNSAEIENLKITNTLSAAKNRVSASWDRMVASTASGGVAGFLKGTLNATAGMIAGATGSSSSNSKRAQYFNPDLATGAGSLFQFMNMLSLGGAYEFSKFDSGLSSMLTGHGYSSGVNQFKSNYSASLGFTDTPTTPEQFHKSEMEKINADVGREEAGKDKATMFEDLAKNWETFSPEVKAKERGVLAIGNRVTKDTLSKLDAGDTSGLMDEAKKAREDAKQARHDEVLRTSVNISDRKRDLAKTSDLQEQTRLAGEIAELEKTQTRLTKEDTDEAQDREKTLFATAKALAEQKEYAQEISQTFKGIGLNSYEEKLLTLQYQIAQADALAKKLHDKQPVASEAIGKKSKELQSELEAAKQVRGLDVAQRNAGIATGMAGAEVESQGVGLSQGEKLLDRQKFLQQELAKYTDLSKMSTNDLLRANVLLTAAKQTELNVSERILENEKERRQTLIDTQREFQKSLIGAGPGELLHKLAESQLAGRNGSRIRTSGQFFSLTGQSQRDVYELMGGERMGSLNAETRALRGRGRSVVSAQGNGSAIDARIDAYGAEYGKRIFADTAVLSQAAKSLNNAGTSADRLAISFDALKVKIDAISLAGRIDPPASPAPSARPVPQAQHVRTEPTFPNKTKYPGGRFTGDPRYN